MPLRCTCSLERTSSIGVAIEHCANPAKLPAAKTTLNEVFLSELSSRCASCQVLQTCKKCLMDARSQESVDNYCVNKRRTIAAHEKVTAFMADVESRGGSIPCNSARLPSARTVERTQSMALL